ncbi:DUF3316 domain-containing protein [Reinekea marinisedimentorum]|uniref:Uncharacterized protein DUF3316 n=1 Tax=Reinekea marinisedimentorum TaxID=230495 RepID=A0A4V2UIV1_9GAMM|nr:DUF3316 domain-containing protein [Reinekea marinisedimentorum]TCS37580.1 uncharacterized protein DUF3316 [Reinekea marinisedimentorum]
MKKIAQFSTALTAALLISAAATAGTVKTQSTTLYTDSYSTAAEAYNAGFDVIDQVDSASKGELKQTLKLYGEGVVRDIALDDAEVTVEEFALGRNNIVYRATVDVDFHYETNKND